MRLLPLQLSMGLIVALLVSGCFPPASGGAGSGESRSGAPKRIVGALHGGEPKAVFGTIGGRQSYGQLLSAGLGNFDHRSEVYAELAEAIPSLENGLWKLFPDGRMEMTWSLKPGVEWHDGAPLTTQDLLFAVQVAQDPEVPYFRHAGFTSVESVDAVDDRTVVVRWKQPYAYGHYMFNRGPGGTNFALPLPKHLLEKPYTETRSLLGEISYWGQDYVGAGPFKLREWVLGSHFLYEANARYVLGRPKLDEIEIRFFQDLQTLVSGALAGTVDMSMAASTVTLEEAVELERVWQGGRIQKIFTSWNVMWPQFIDPKPAVLAHLPFRQALVHGLDRQLLADTIMAGVAPVAHTYLPPTSPYYDELDRYVVKYEYDPRKAMSLLETLGNRRGADGMFRDPAGQLIEVGVRASATGEASKLMFAIPDQWKQIGVSGYPDPPQPGGDREYAATYPSFMARRYNLQLSRLVDLSSAQIPRPETRFVGQNDPRYSSPELDALLNRMIVTVPQAEHNAVVGQILNHISGNLVGVGIFYSAETTFLSNRLKNVIGNAQPSDFTYSHLWDVE